MSRPATGQGWFRFEDYKYKDRSNTISGGMVSDGISFHLISMHTSDTDTSDQVEY